MLQDKTYDKDDDVIKATSFEVISTLRDVLKTSSLWRDHVQTYTQVFSLFKILVVFLFCMLMGIVIYFFQSLWIACLRRNLFPLLRSYD